MNTDDNVTTLKKSALIISLKAYVRDHYTKIRKVLVSGEWINDSHRRQLAKRMKHCFRITRHIARMDHTNYHFTLNSTKRYGDPLHDFLSSWNSCDGGKITASLELDNNMNTVCPPTFIPIDNRLIVQ